MRSILDYIKVFKNIETYKDPKLRHAKAEFSPVFDPDLEQSEFLRPGETLEDWKPNPFLKPHAEGGRAGYNDGQLVRPTVDGSRAGYAEPKYNRKKVFKDINLEKYTEYLDEQLKSGDMSKTKVYKTWLNDQYGSKKGNYFYSETYKEFGDDFVRKTQGVYRNKKNDLLRDLVNKANLSEKWGVEKKDILKKIISSGQTFKKYTPDEKVFALSQRTPWLDREYLDTLHKRKDKVKMVFNNIVKDDEIIGPSKKYKRIHPKGNIISDMIMEKTGLTDIKTVRAGISETNWYKQNEDLYRYMTHRGGRGEIKGLSFSEAIKFADEKRGSLEIKNLAGKAVKYQTAENHIVQFSARHAQRHFKDGTWKDSQIKFYKNGKLMTEADWAKLPVNKRGNKILDWNKVSFKHGNKVFHKGNLRTEGPKFKPFDEVYKLNKLFSKGVTDPNNIKGPKIPLKKLLNIMEDKLVLGHDDAKGGVKTKPYSGLKIQSQSVNDSLFKAYSHIKDKSLRKQVVKEIWGDLSGKSGQTYTDLFVEGAEEEAKNFLKNIDKVKLSPYRQAATNIIEKSPEWMKWSSRKQAELFKVAGVSSKDFNAIKNKAHTLLKDADFNIDKCLSSGGRVGFANPAGLVKGPNQCIIGVINDEMKLAKKSGNMAKFSKFGKLARAGGYLVGWVDIPIELAFALPSLLAGDVQGAKRATTAGLFGWGGKRLDEIDREKNPEVYKYFKHVQDINDWMDAFNKQQNAETKLGELPKGYAEIYQKHGDKSGYTDFHLKQYNEAVTKQEDILKNYIGYTDELGEEDLKAQEIARQGAQEYLGKEVKKGWKEGWDIDIPMPDALPGGFKFNLAPFKPDEITNLEDFLKQKGDPFYGKWWKRGTRHAAEELGAEEKLYGDWAERQFGKKDPEDIYSELPLEYASQLAALEKKEVMKDPQYKYVYRKPWEGVGYASGGLASLTRTVAPDSGPMDQGLRSLYINDKDY